MIRIRNMIGSTGVNIVNQFEITTNNGSYFQSYDTVVVHKDIFNNITMGTGWENSVTTGKYRNLFLNEDKKTTLSKLTKGVYKFKHNLEITD